MPERLEVVDGTTDSAVALGASVIAAINAAIASQGEHGPVPVACNAVLDALGKSGQPYNLVIEAKLVRKAVE